MSLPATAPDPVSALAERADSVAEMLRALANTHRLQLLCLLAKHGELSVGALVDGVGLSQPALSQHLAKLRDDAIVTNRRDGQSILYRIADPRVEALMGSLYELFCQPAPSEERPS